MRIIKKIPIDRIFSKIYQDFGLEDIEESTIVEWAGDVLSHIEIDKTYVERVAFIEVKNHQIELPNDLIGLLRVARNNRWEKPQKNCTVTKEEVKEMGCEIPVVENNEIVPCVQNIPVLLNCRGELVTPYGVAYYRPNFKVDHDYYVWTGSNTYRDYFTLVRPSSNSFKAALICEIEKEKKDRIYSSVEDEYQIIDGKYLRFSFREGQVAVAYLAQAIDLKSGYPLIPDDISVIKAITHYILYMYCRKMHIIGREGYKEKYKEAEADYQWYISQAQNKLFAPHGIDEFQAMTEQRYSFLPNIYKYRTHERAYKGYRSAQEDIDNINRNHG